ncbi:hypothetical protein V6N13_132637 [Hibiscus sabdariffa]
MKLSGKPPSSSSSSSQFLLVLLLFIFFIACTNYSNAQTPTATTDPSEVRALNSIFQQWQIQAADLWNISGEPCSGTALTDSFSVFEDPANNPAIRCDCSFNNRTLCHITSLRVYGLDRRGVIPEELLDLPFLNFLKIDKNSFSGPLPAFIGNLSRLGLLSIAHNDFSGPIPKELANCKKLYLLYINSCGLSGEIPSTFANLVELRIVWASDTALTGKIPDFVGNWTKLTSLRLEGNSFEGPIPSSFENLASLTSLRIGGIYNGSSSLDFVRNLKNLTDLVLRNVMLTGTLPSYITELQSLQKLDLSFNNLTGPIPRDLFNMNSLIYLFLGNNSLSGSIPSQKSETLQTIDLSYNLLSGNLPSWVNSGLQLNLVANNFTLTSSNRRFLAGLECLQRSFPCNRNAPRYANFSINCGGPQMTPDGILFEADNSTLGAAKIHVTSTQKWAVSNAGLFADRENQQYVQNSLAQVRETGFADRSSQSWTGLGRRIFDVYIQGTRRLRDFDISKEAGGVERAITRNFTANVTGNHLEIHLFWAGKGSCCTPERGYYGPSVSAISVVPNFRPTVSGIPPGNPKEKNNTALIAGVTVPVVALALILIFAIIYVKRKREEDNEEEVLLGISPRPNTFSYSELKAATEDFSPSNKLGEGGFGPVYKGTLADGRVVAVKQLSVASNQGKEQFVTEIATISAVQHRYLVKLYGCCIGGNRRLLVLEYLVNKSLDQALWGENVLHLDWPTRFNICLSTARGLAYLHEDSRPRIVHRDVKASNILLDEELCPKISDFGLAKLYDDTKTHLTTRAAGTIGYLAPEYAMRGHLSDKVDVFGFGVVTLEIISGRPNSYNTSENERTYLLEWAWTLHENNQILSLLDQKIGEFDENEALRVIGVALLCTQASPSMRPTMSRVVGMLTGDFEVSIVTTKPSYITDWDYEDVTGKNEEAHASDHGSSDHKGKNKTTSGLTYPPIPSPVNITEFREVIGEGSPGVGSDSVEFRTLGSLPSCPLSKSLKEPTRQKDRCQVRRPTAYRKMILNGKAPSPSKCLLLLLLFIVFFIGCSKYCNAQTPTATTTDPSEVRALNEIFQQWETQAPDGWNISGEPCSGVALSQSDSVFEDPANNPSIRCDCSFESSTVCHITRLRVFSLEKRGRIPQQLLAFRYLNFFKIDQNYFTGPLPAFLGNMSNLQLLSVAHNSLSGPVPKEIGNLKKLYLLSLGVNNFSGAIPPELGNLVELQQLYINSCGLTGEIPSTFVNLWNLQIVAASDNAFTGKIPEFIGSNWTRLESLRLEGNSFEGPIPANIGNLTSLTMLRITGIFNGSTSLDFVTNLKNISDLVLRNVLLTGSIPSDISEFQSLQKLDLSFNSLTGQIPSELFNMNSLTYLFLGNNSLSGTLPRRKSENIETVDVSYNHLSGNLPSWIDSSLQLNLVANNFTLDSSDIRLLPGLQCLQRGFPCNRKAPRYANFAIKCGGPQLTADGIVFEAENSSLGTATFHVTSTQKWAVSNVGLYEDRENPLYVQNTNAQVKNTNTPALYHTSRTSPVSLRYYGLGLENGPYTVNLFFAETAYPDRSTLSSRSIGRRVFDIYIQGGLQVKDFDISKEAGGAVRAITRKFRANVIDNHLEIHLLWTGKGTCCVPELGYYGPSISAISVVPDFKPTVRGLPPGTSKRMTALIVGIAVPVGAVALMLIYLTIYLKRRKQYDDEEVLLAIGPRTNIFSYVELKTATEDFSPSNKLGEGGFGAVFKGTFSDGRVVAVKQLSVASHQGKNQFIAEVATISAVQHRNLVKLHGCCIEGKRNLLVYEYLENKSLDHALFGRSELHLDWPTRFNICLETASGLAYLHEESRPRIVHRDIKASNILLDAELCPKISDFGLAKLYDDKKTHISTRVAGTIGYLAPEYAMCGHLTEKADVFGFGIVALEILSGRPNSDNSLEDDKIYLLGWAWTLHENNQSLDLVDPNLAEFDINEALRVARVALLCTQGSPSMRPPMSRVVSMLAGDIEVSGVITRPSYLTDWNFKDLTGVIVSEDARRPGAAPAPILSAVNVSELSDLTEGR